MKAFIGILVLVSSFSAFSAQTIADKLLVKAEPLAHNGGCGVSTYDVRTFNYQAEMKKFSAIAFKRFGRDASLSFRHDEVLHTIKYSIAVGSEYESDFQFAVKKLSSDKKIKTMFSSQPGPSCEESEYCSITDFTLYFVDGSILNCDFDYTT